jgi:hypothetical protein
MLSQFRLLSGVGGLVVKSIVAIEVEPRSFDGPRVRSVDLLTLIRAKN